MADRSHSPDCARERRGHRCHVVVRDSTPRREGPMTINNQARHSNQSTLMLPGVALAAPTFAVGFAHVFAPWINGSGLPDVIREISGDLPRLCRKPCSVVHHTPASRCGATEVGR